MIKYKYIRCPKCNQRYFKERMITPLIDLAVFMQVEAPIYKNGEWINKPEEKKTSKSFLCLNCNCNFRIEYFESQIKHFNKKSFTLIDEDRELEERLAKFKEEQEKKAKEEVNIKTSENNNLTINTDISSAIKVINYNDPCYTTIKSYGEGTESTINLGDFIINSSTHFTDDQIKNMKEIFGWDVENIN